MGVSVLVVPVRASHLTGESGNGSVGCGGDRLLPSSCLPVRASHRGRVLVWLRVVWRRPACLGIFVGARLPPPRVSPGAAPRGVAAVDTPPLFRRERSCAPPLVAGESGMAPR